MPQTAEILTELPNTIRRFQEADLCTHTWIMKRLQERFPHQNERALATFLRGLFSNNEYLFLFSNEGCALAQVIRTFTLEAEPIVQERFVWVEDPKNVLQTNAAAEFYSEMERWAKSLGVTKILVEEWTDVPHEKIKERLGRIFTQQLSFTRV